MLDIWRGILQFRANFLSFLYKTKMNISAKGN